MEVLFITHKYPPSIGGMEKQSFELIKGMQSKCKVHVLAYKGGQSKILWFFRLKNQIKNLLKDQPNIRIIHLNDGLMAAFCTWLSDYTTIPIVVTFHGLDLIFPLKYYQNHVLRKMQSFHGFVGVSQATAKEAILRGFDKNRVKTILNGVDHEMASIPKKIGFRELVAEKYKIPLEGKKILITMGRPVKRKGFSWFLNQVLPKLDDDIIFIIIGSKGKKNSLVNTILNAIPSTYKHLYELLMGMETDANDIASALKQNPKAYHVGKLDFETMVQFLKLADLFVMPNIKVNGDMEGFGLVALEAALNGTPVLASNIEGITDAVHDGKNGILIPSGDSEKWIQCIHQVLNDRHQLNNWSNSVIHYTKNQYGWKKMTDGYFNFFKEIIQKESINGYP